MSATFTNGISDSLANLASDGNPDKLSTAAGDDTNVNITISNDSTSMAAADLSAVTGSTAGTVTLSNSQTITGTGAEVEGSISDRCGDSGGRNNCDSRFWCCDISS